MRIRVRQAVGWTPYARSLSTALAVGTAWCLCGPAAATDPGASKLVVVIYPSESDSAPGVMQVNQALRSTFAGQSSEYVEIRNEYVDTNRLRDSEFMRAHVALLQQKYAGRKIDLVIAGLSAGLDFTLAVRDEVFPGVPVVFVAVDQREVAARDLPPDVIGVPIRMDLEGTLDLALRLHPDTRRVFVVVGSSAFDVEWEAEARRKFGPYKDGLEFVYLTGLPLEELLGRVANLPQQSIVYFLHMHRDGTGKPTVSAEVLDHLAARANAPVYGHVNTYVGRGIVGGSVFSFETEGSNAARLGLRILTGERPGTMTVPGASENVLWVDSRQLRRWGIDDQDLPPGSVIHFREATFWGTYRWRIVAVATLVVVQTLLIAGLLLQRVMRRRADALFSQVFHTAPAGMLMVDTDGTMVLANAQVETFFGYRQDELRGQPVEMLVSDRVRDRHVEDRVPFFAAPEVRPICLGQDLHGRRKDGTVFPMEIGLSSVRTGHGRFALAFIIDLTERRKAEEGLQANRLESKRLAGRLLEAQEAERRRIARELHDDINQRLALLAVEMDMLVGSSAETPAVANRLRELSAQVKELSSSVHDLSHQLHPSKLEQVGLVAAVRGLCVEVGHAHGLDVKFTHDPDHARLQRDTAVCLYRIVQESLRNVVKHSGSRHAAVDLSATVGETRLQISDDGIGFEPSANGDGLGLVSMRERLHLVGGELAICSKASGGTRIEIRIPTRAAAGPNGEYQT